MAVSGAHLLQEEKQIFVRDLLMPVYGVLCLKARRENIENIQLA